MEWTRTDTLALAFHSCSTCHGLGLLIGKRGKVTPCGCVLRNVFRACYKRFHYCQKKEKYMSKSSLRFAPGTDRRRAWDRKDEEYSADFLLIARRTLTPEEYKLFNYHFLLGAAWKLCTRKLKIDRGTFFHAVYRIERKLGLVYCELEPYCLYPLDEYFSTNINRAQVIRMPERPGSNGQPLAPPLLQAA